MTRCLLPNRLSILTALVATWIFILSSNPTVQAAQDDPPSPSSHVLDAAFSSVNEDPLPPPPECTRQSSRYDALACWLLGLKLNLPDQSFRSGLVTLEVKGMQCSQFVLDGVTSQTISREEAYSSDKSTFNMTIAEISAFCDASYHAIGMGGNMHVQAGAMDDNKALRWTLGINNRNTSSFARPDSVHTLTCQTALTVVDLRFTGSISARLVDLFRHMIADYVSKEINNQVCPYLETQASPLLTKYIRQINEYMDPYIQDENTSFIVGESTTSSKARTLSEQPGDSATVSLSSQAPVLVRWLTVFNDYLDYFLDRGFLRHWFPKTDCRDLDCGWIFSGVNGFLTDVLRPKQGRADVPVPPSLHAINLLLPAYARIEVDIETISMSGIDKWQQVQVLHPSDEGFKTRLATLDGVALAIEVSIDVSSIPGGVFHGEHLQESFTVELNMSSLDAWLTMGIELESASWKNLTMGSVIDVIRGIIRDEPSEQLGCLSRAVASIHVVDLGAMVTLSELAFVPTSKLGNGILKGQLERELDNVVNNILSLGLSEYPVYISRAIFGLSRGPLKNGLNELLTVTAPDTSCTMPPSKKLLPLLLNFSEFPYLNAFNELLHDPSTLEQLNGFVNCTSNFLSRAVVDFARSFPLTKQTPDSSSLDIHLKAFEIRNAGSMRDVQLLAPAMDGMALEDSVSFGSVSNHSSLTEDAQLFASVDIDFSPMNLSISIDSVFAVQSLEMLSGTSFRYDCNELDRMGVSDVLTYSQCLALPMLEVDVYQMRGNLGPVTVMMNANVSTGLGTNHYQIVLDSQSHPSVQSKLSTTLEWLLNTTRDLITVTSLEARTTAKQDCPARKSEFDQLDGDNINTIGIFLTIAVFIVLAQPAIFLIPKERRSSLNTTADSAPDGVDGHMAHPLLVDEPPDAVFYEFDHQRNGETSLGCNESIPFAARVGIPVLIVGTLCLLLTSNVGIGATVDLYTTINSRLFVLPSVFSFSLLNTARDMLAARIYPLLILVVGFSGIWPYTKLVMLLYAWLAPPAKLSHSLRGQYLLALDALGKLSLVDTYVLILFVVAFRYHLFLSNDTALDVFVIPQFGFYGFLVATSASLLAGHLSVWFHRRSELQHIHEDDCAVDSLFSHDYQVDDSRRRLSNKFKALVLGLLFLCVLIISVGISRKSFVFEVGGLAGYALGDERRSVYSLLSLGSALRSSSPIPNDPCVFLLQWVYYFYSVITPYTCLLLLCALLTIPLTLKQQLMVLSFAEIANAWSAIEVFALSIIAALLEISTFASFMVGDRCDFIEELLKDHNIEDELATCYTVKASVSPSASVLVAGALLNAFAVWFVLRLAHLAVHETMERNSDRKGHDQLGDRVMGCNVIQWLAFHFPWAVCEHYVLDTETEDASPEVVRSDSGRNNAFDETWSQEADRDPTWKEWKETVQYV